MNVGIGPRRSSKVCSLMAALWAPKASPGEHRQAEVDGSGVQGTHDVGEVKAERLVGVDRPRDVDEHLREVGEDAPVVCLVGIGQRGARDLAAKAHVIELAWNRTQTGFDVAGTFAKG